ncbi:MAG: EAL domain-containing protein [Clostridiales bacterium]|nr:EAL domain-containing protein [Clostridiales bacterium]
MDNARENTKGFMAFTRRMEQSIIVRSIRNGLVSMIPVLIIGAFALIIKTFPVEGYQTFIQTFLNGFILKLFDIIYSATFGVLSVYMTFAISRSFMKLQADTKIVQGGAVFSALISFFILAGVYLEGFSTDNMGPKSMFLAIITGLGASALYIFFFRLFSKRKRVLFSMGADREFNRMLSTLPSIVVVVSIFALFNHLVVTFSNEDSFRSLLATVFNAFFLLIPSGFFKGLVFVLMSSILWFFGIHGSDTLETVMQANFAGGLDINMAAVEAGSEPVVILTKQFFDCFVLMGGCGSTICLLIAILLFSKNRARRGLGFTAAFPMIFNINELMVFGLPIIFNPIMLIPFLAVPMVCYSIAYAALSLGIVPYITNGIEWTTPIILGGYSATGSVAGALLQVFNVIVGVLIYLPFVKILDKQTDDSLKRDYESFVDFFRANESSLGSEKLTSLSNAYGDFAKSLCADIKHDYKEKIVLSYQPQYNYEGKCVGVEALLRYKHHLHGIIYPPLVIKLAEEGEFLPMLEEGVMERVLEDMEKVKARFGEDVKISFNVTGTTFTTPRFFQYCKNLHESGKLNNASLCIEVTEQAAIAFNNDSVSGLKNLRELGFSLAIDDFSMGQTSINYLKNDLFDELKLDGSLVKGLALHENCREIISSITHLASSLNLMVLAEYVETEEQREELHEIGCDCYQGYLYSPAVFLDEEN